METVFLNGISLKETHKNCPYVKVENKQIQYCANKIAIYMQIYMLIDVNKVYTDLFIL